MGAATRNLDRSSREGLAGVDKPCGNVLGTSWAAPGMEAPGSCSAFSSEVLGTSWCNLKVVAPAKLLRVKPLRSYKAVSKVQFAYGL